MKYLPQFQRLLRGITTLCCVTLSGAVLTTPVQGSMLRTYVNGWGGVQVGMTIEQASQAAGVKFILDKDVHRNGCRYAQPPQRLKDVSLLLTNGRVARIDIGAGSLIKTRRGAGVGDSEDRIKALYPGRIEVARHEYNSQGHYLTFVPTSARHQAYRVVFETDGQKVVNYRVGKLPEVSYAEGCS
jgi:hypothetical protein